MNTVLEIQRINDQELERGIAGTPASWHAKYASSAWIYVGNLDYSLTEGDVLCVLSQYGEMEDIHLVREEDTGKSKGFCFAKYEDARSCVLAVDNLCGSVVCGKTLRVDHVENYRLPKDLQETKNVQPGHAYQDKELNSDYDLQRGQNLFGQPVVDSDAKQSKLKRKEERDRIRREREKRRAERKRDKKTRKDEGEGKHKKKRRRSDSLLSREERSE